MKADLWGYIFRNGHVLLYHLNFVCFFIKSASTLPAGKRKRLLDDETQKQSCSI